MSFWDRIGDVGEGWVNSALAASENVVGSFVEAKGEQLAARYSPQVEYQNRGEPESIKPEIEQKQLVGEVPEGAAVVDKKMLYIGGGALVLVAVVGLLLIKK